jgi:pentatricopeptide repeat protein
MCSLAKQPVTRSQSRCFDVKPFRADKATKCIGAGDAEAFLEALRSDFEAFPPPASHIVDTIRELAGRGSYDLAVGVCEMAIELGLEVNGAAVSLALDACSRAWMPERAHSLFWKMDDLNLVRTDYAYNAVILAMGRTGKWERSLEILEHMRAAGIDANVYTSGNLITSFGAAGRCDLAEKLFCQMCRSWESPKDDMPCDFKILRNSVCAVVSDDMLHASVVRPNRASCHSLIYAYKRNKENDKAAALFVAMTECSANFYPDDYTYKVMNSITKRPNAAQKKHAPGSMRLTTYLHPAAKPSAPLAGIPHALRDTVASFRITLDPHRAKIFDGIISSLSDPFPPLGANSHT